jgi:molybdate transport system substrate-binding protein
MNAVPRFALVASLIVLSALSPAAAQDRPVVVFAAASLKNSIDDINAAFAKETSLKAVASYGASSALARQIDHDAPADLFVSADLDWMDYLAQRQRIRDDTRVNLLGNRLVLIAPKDSPLAPVSIAPGFDLAALAGGNRIAVADVRTVPAGKYAKAALEALGAWGAAQPKLAMAENVRAALVLVARAEAPLGIVYETDAKIEPGVKILGRFPKTSHPEIVYPAALTKDAKPQAARYLEFMRSSQAKTIFEKYGFTFLSAKPAWRHNVPSPLAGQGQREG